MHDYVFVWRDAPGDTATLQPLVRAANGTSTREPDGFDLAANYGRWCSQHGASLPAWSYMYPGNSGDSVAAALLAAAPVASYYVLDIEDSGVAKGQVAACVGKLRQHAPTYLSTWGDVSQADSRGIPYSGVGFSGVMPQSYYPYQIAGIDQWSGVFREVYPTFSPADNPQWLESVDDRPCGIWRYGITNIPAAAGGISGKRAISPDPTKVGDTMPIDIDHYVDRLNVLARDGHLDDFFRRLLTIHRDTYGGQSVVQNVAAIKSAVAKIAAEESAPGSTS